jgi:hypothetical protein
MTWIVGTESGRRKGELQKSIKAQSPAAGYFATPLPLSTRPVSPSTRPSPIDRGLLAALGDYDENIDRESNEEGDCPPIASGRDEEAAQEEGPDEEQAPTDDKGTETGRWTLRDKNAPPEERLRRKRDITCTYRDQKSRSKLFDCLQGLISGGLSVPALRSQLDADIAPSPGGDKADENFLSKLEPKMQQLKNKACHLIVNWCGLGDRPHFDCDPAMAPQAGISPGDADQMPITEAVIYGIQATIGVPCYSTEIFKVFVSSSPNHE